MEILLKNGAKVDVTGSVAFLGRLHLHYGETGKDVKNHCKDLVIALNANKIKFVPEIKRKYSLIFQTMTSRNN